MCRATGSLSLFACRAACLPTRARLGREHEKASADEDAITRIDRKIYSGSGHPVCISSLMLVSRALQAIRLGYYETVSVTMTHTICPLLLQHARN